MTALLNPKFWPYYLIIALCIFIGIQNANNNRLRNDIMDYKSQNQSLEMTLSQLKVMSDAQTKKVVAANKEAQKIYEGSHAKIKDIFSQPIRKPCEQAVADGVKLGQKI